MSAWANLANRADEADRTDQLGNVLFSRLNLLLEIAKCL